MNQHPTQEKWMEFLYQELDAPETRAFELHLANCAECRQKHAGLSSTAKTLNQWQVSISPRHRFARSWAPALKWAAAAAVLVTTAFATGRFSRPEIDLAQLQTQLARPIQENISRELHSRFEAELLAAKAETEKALAEALAANKQHVEQLARTLATVREQDRQAVYASLKELETQQALEFRKLRQNLETVAVLTDQSLKDAQRRLFQLASYTANQN